MTKQDIRIQSIIEVLKDTGAATTRELSEKCEVTEMTTRRDLLRLSEDNLIKIVHGGALYIDPERKNIEDEYDHFYAETRNEEVKERIGKKAAELVETKDTIILGIGSTTDKVAKNIRQDIDLTILCYAPNIFNTVCRTKKWQTIVPGGYFHYNSWMFESSDGVKFIKNMRANKAFLGASGVNYKLGVTCSYLYEVETRKAVINSSDVRILVVDSSKFGEVKVGHFAELSDFNIVITDTGIPEDYIDVIKEMGIQLYMV